MHEERLQESAEERALVRGLADAGLERAEIDAFLAYSREVEIELGPQAVPLGPRRSARAPWILLAAAAVLLFAVGGWAAMLLGERSALARELAQVRGEHDQFSSELRASGAQQARLEGELALAQREMKERLADEAAVQSELVRYFQGRLLEHAAMGDPRALPTAGFLSDVARELPQRVKAGDFRDAWSRLVPPFDLLGSSPTAYDDLELAKSWR